MLIRRTSPTGVVWYESPVLREIGAPHAFSTRRGGVSSAPFDSLSFGNPTGHGAPDPRGNIDENHRRLARAAGLPEGSEAVCRVHQVHGREVVIVRLGEAHDSHAKADGIVSDDPSRVISVRTADCVPVLLATVDGGVVAAVHAGWRGVALGVVETALDAVRSLRPGIAIVGAVGPGIGFDAFEVGGEVVEAMAARIGGRDELEGAVVGVGGGKWRMDLSRLIVTQLARGGVERWDVTDRCTVRDEAEFFSHRRDRGVTGRMVAVICARGSLRRGEK